MTGKKSLLLWLLCAALALRFLCPGVTSALGTAFHRLGGGQAVRAVGRLLEEGNRVFNR